MAFLANPPARFDRLARLYRAMEYLSFGPMLERCRYSHLVQLTGARRALVIGDGDGRFVRELLIANRQIHADVIDASPAMLRRLTRRVSRAKTISRLTVACADARTFAPAATGYDLVVTHFFLDCLTATDTQQLIARIRPHLVPGARWLVSEFDVPAAGPLRVWLSRGIIAALYTAFRLLTGLAVREIPPWRQLLAHSGFTRTASHTWLGGLLTSELWEYCETTAPAPAHSHKEVFTSAEFASASGPLPGFDPPPFPSPNPGPAPEPDPAPGPPPDPDPEPYPGPMPVPQPVTRSAAPAAHGV
jgi:SAM-dependent methyltransferase